MNKYEKSFNYLKGQLIKRYNINEVHPNIVNECVEYNKCGKALTTMEKLVVRATPMETKNNKCARCNHRINDKDNFCSNCGQAIDKEIYYDDEDWIL